MLVVALALCFAQESRPAAPPAALGFLEQAARSLAKSGRREESVETLDLLGALGLAKGAQEKLRGECMKELAKNAAPRAPGADAARSLKSAADALVKSLMGLEGDERRKLAETILRIDGSAADARKALGFERAGNAWLTAGERDRRARRAEIGEFLRKARRLEVRTEVAESDHPTLVAAYGKKGVRVTWRGITVHSGMGAEKTSRILREALRATAVSNALVDGELKLPTEEKSTWVLTDSKLAYMKSIDDGLRHGGLTDKDAKESREFTGYRDRRGFGVEYGLTEGEEEAAFLVYFTHLDAEQACLEAGHLNAVALRYLGAPIPSFAWVESTAGEAGRGATTADASPAAKKEREELLRVSKAGIAGCRSWMTYLARRREDPAWSRSMVDQMGKVSGDDLLKSTLVVEMLQERGPLRPLLRATTPGVMQSRAKGATDVMSAALGESLALFEERWRRWLLGETPSLLERIQARDAPALSSLEEDVLRRLNVLRAKTFSSSDLSQTPLVTLDRSLSDGAQLHALYLAKYPDQAAAWPDAHEEYPDREGFTPEGAWSGLHSVIVPGCTTPAEALDAWMGTFYHRIPLLEPGLARIGWALEKKVAVLDSDSLCAPPDHAWEVPWPFDGMTDVPTHFAAPELPNPVPGADQSHFGYPITFQVGVADVGQPAIDVRLRLFKGDEKGREIECHVSTPSQPTNPDLAPERAFCLIPKSPLEPHSRYAVTAERIGVAKKTKWTFTTK